MPTHRRSFPGDPRELRAARQWIHAMLDGHPCSDDAALIVTELGTNAVVHTASGGSTFQVTLTVSPLAVVIEVTDLGTPDTSPRVQRPTPDSTHGRGLGMVAALADRLQTRGDDSGHTVTAELHTPAHPQGPVLQPVRAEGLLP
ncbi:ATP-binding protein [Streptomyces sp. NPDC018057]|uniref:ATP-binding protein n=1 Tax=unclassified Streptomyces TaxID=2593676 RepID=UPI00378B8DB1